MSCELAIRTDIGIITIHTEARGTGQLRSSIAQALKVAWEGDFPTICSAKLVELIDVLLEEVEKHDLQVRNAGSQELGDDFGAQRLGIG